MAAEHNEGHYVSQLQNRPWDVASRDIEDALRRLTHAFHKTAGGIQIANSGLLLGSFDVLDFAGDLIVSVNADPINGTITITLPNYGSVVGLGSANSNGTSIDAARADHVHKREVEVLDEAAAVGVRRKLNFVGGTVAAVDNAGQDRVDVNLPDYGTPVSLDVTNSDGVSSAVPHADHKHASGLTTKGDILGRTATANARIPGPPTTYNADGWPYVMQGGLDANHMAGWGLPWTPQLQKALVNNTVTDIMYLQALAAAAANQPWGAAILRYAVLVHDNTNVQVESGLLHVGCIRDSAGTITNQLTKEAKTTLVPVGTLAVTFTLSNDAGNNRVIVRVNANSSLAATRQELVLSLEDQARTGLLFPFGL